VQVTAQRVQRLALVQLPGDLPPVRRIRQVAGGADRPAQHPPLTVTEPERTLSRFGGQTGARGPVGLGRLDSVEIRGAARPDLTHVSPGRLLRGATAYDTVEVDLREAWQTRADAWVRWARSPELDDDFWLFHLRHFLGLLPPPERLTVDVGCGEGRLTRALAAAGYRVAGADTAFPLVKAALTHPRGAPAIVGDAARLPFPDESADLVIAFMCLHDFDDMPAAVAEAARILTPGGRFAMALHHPFITARFAGTYVAERRYTLTVQHNDASMTYEGTHRPLAAYSTALTAAGLVIETIREPAKDHAGQPTAPFFDLLARR
jgi:SAM-dependent methyltransferase